MQRRYLAYLRSPVLERSYGLPGEDDCRHFVLPVGLAHFPTVLLTCRQAYPDLGQGAAPHGQISCQQYDLSIYPAIEAVLG